MILQHTQQSVGVFVENSVQKILLNQKERQVFSQMWKVEKKSVRCTLLFAPHESVV